MTALSSLAVNVIPIVVGSELCLASEGVMLYGNSSVPGSVLFKSSTMGGSSKTTTPGKVNHNTNLTMTTSTDLMCIDYMINEMYQSKPVTRMSIDHVIHVMYQSKPEKSFSIL